jgi:hypothetical protein
LRGGGSEGEVAFHISAVKHISDSHVKKISWKKKRIETTSEIWITPGILPYTSVAYFHSFDIVTKKTKN